MKKFIWIIGLLVLGVSAWASDQDSKYVEGTHYQLIAPAVPTSTEDGKIEVVELFWYGCPHCYALEPFMQSWLKDKPDNVSFTRIPAVLNASWEIHARTYYALELMGKLEMLHNKFFSAIHDDGKKLNDKESIAKFLADNGVDSDVFLKTFDSFAVTTRIQRARQLGKAYGVDGVPSIIVNGEFRTSAGMAGGHPELIEVINLLVDKVAANQTK